MDEGRGQNSPDLAAELCAGWDGGVSGLGCGRMSPRRISQGLASPVSADLSATESSIA